MVSWYEIVPPPLILIIIALFWILTGLPSALFPTKVKVFGKRLYRKLHLISATKCKKPIKKRTIIVTSLYGWVFFIAGIVVLLQMPVQFAFLPGDGLHSSQTQLVLPGEYSKEIAPNARLKTKVNKNLYSGRLPSFPPLRTKLGSGLS